PTVARIGRRQRALAEPSCRNQNDQWSRTMVMETLQQSFTAQLTWCEGGHARRESNYHVKSRVRDRLRAVAPAIGALPARPQALSGCDASPAIVSVDADSAGCAHVWQRRADGVAHTRVRFPNWFLTTSLEWLAHLPARHVSAEALRQAHGQLAPDGLQ